MPKPDSQPAADLQELIALLTASLAAASPSSLDDKINDALGRICSFALADRSFLYQFENGNRTLRHTHYYVSEGSRIPENIFEINIVDSFPWVAREIAEGRALVASGGLDASRFPEDLKQRLKNDGVTSAAVVPMIVEGESIGAFGLDTTGPPHSYSEDVLQRLALFANILGLTIQRVKKTSSLARNLELFRTFMDNNPALVYIKDGDLQHRYANQTLLNELGLSLGEFVGTTSCDFFDSETAERIEKADRVVLSGESSTEVRDFPMEIQGKTKWLQEVKFALPVDGGERRIGGIAVDITDRKESEEALKVTLKELQALKESLELENVLLREEMELTQVHSDIVGRSPQMKVILSQVEQVAATESTVLISGETGTGKEVIARQIHKLSTRDKKPLVKVNCAALPATLIESELFGREKGAFTGAMARQVGRFEFADGGTIFLDEVGELPLELQAKLLRVLQDGEFERLGSPQTHKVDVRVIAATNRDLERSAGEGRFREDLLYRLNIFPITIPPLRERREDIPPLVWFFVQQFLESMGKAPLQISRRTMGSIMEHDWPGNARELRNILERAVILSKGSNLKVELPEKAGPDSPAMMTLEESEKKHILDALTVTGGRVFGERGAARILDINPKTLYSRMKKLGISRSDQTAKSR